VILLDTEVPGYGISPALIAAVALVSALFFIFIIGMAVKARRRPIVSGQEELLGALGTVLEDFESEGRVRIHSEVWNARSRVSLRKGEQVRVLSMQGLVLNVEPISRENTGG